MQNLFYFNESKYIYDVDFSEILPKSLDIYRGNNKMSFKLGNIMKHFDLIQCTYHNEDWGSPGTLEIDLYFLKETSGKIKIDVDITLGNQMVSEFSIIQPNNISQIYKPLGLDKSKNRNVFTFEDKSLDDLIIFLDKFSNTKLNRNHFKFLDRNYFKNLIL